MESSQAPHESEFEIGAPLYEYDPLKWLYIGWEGDHPKSWTFTGGGLALGQSPTPIQYALTIGNRTYCPDESSPTRKADQLRLPAGRTWDLPAPAQRASPYARFYDHAGLLRHSRFTNPNMLPSAFATASAPELYS